MHDLESSSHDTQVPLHKMQAFGSGLKRKPITFVPESSATEQPAAENDKDISNVYLSIVLPHHKQSQSVRGIAEDQHVQDSLPLGDTAIARCSICNGYLGERQGSTKHESTLQHQLALQHTQPPSSLDRKRKGLRVMARQGWDPDSRLGLGSLGQGRLFPVGASGNEGNRGLGASSQDRDSGRVQRKKAAPRRHPKRTAAAQHEKDNHTRNLFYRDDEINEYLGLGF